MLGSGVPEMRRGSQKFFRTDARLPALVKVTSTLQGCLDASEYKFSFGS